MFGLAKMASYHIGDKVSWGPWGNNTKYKGTITEVDDDIVEVQLPNGQKTVVDIDGLAKKAFIDQSNIDVSSLIANGIKRIPQMDDLANLAIVANAKNKQSQSQNNQQQNPSKAQG